MKKDFKQSKPTEGKPVGMENPEKKGKPFKRNAKVSKLSMNDPSWYVLHPELLKDVASLSFPEWMGKGFRFQYPATTHHVSQTTVLELDYLYTVGYSKDSGSPINLAIRNLYTYVRHANSGHTNYESSDLGMYLISVGSLFASCAHVERILGVAKYFEHKNIVTPITLSEALGDTNPSLTSANLANYTTRLNVCWQRLASLCLPKDFKFIQRWIWMNSQVFKDHESSKAAYIVFRPISVPLFLATSIDTGGCIYQSNNPASVNTTAGWLSDIELALDRVLGDEDMNIISGDILKAYGEENLIKCGMTPLDYMVRPVYVEEMLPQVQHVITPKNIPGNNANRIVTGVPYEVGVKLNDQTSTLYTAAQQANDFYIYQLDQDIICSPCEQNGATAATIDSTSGALYWYSSDNNNIIRNALQVNHFLLNSYEEIPTPENIILATRLMYTERGDSRLTGSPLYIAACGSEIVQGIVLHTVNDLGAKVLLDFSSQTICSTTTFTTGLFNATLSQQVDWAPITYLYEVNGTPSSSNRVKIADVVGDIDNYTYLDFDRLEAMHLNAILAEFAVTKMNFLQ